MTENSNKCESIQSDVDNFKITINSNMHNLNEQLTKTDSKLENTSRSVEELQTNIGTLSDSMQDILLKCNGDESCGKANAENQDAPSNTPTCSSVESNSTEQSSLSDHCTDHQMFSQKNDHDHFEKHEICENQRKSNQLFIRIKSYVNTKHAKSEVTRLFVVSPEFLHIRL